MLAQHLAAVVQACCETCWMHSQGFDTCAMVQVSLSGNNMRYHGKSGYGGGASVQYSHSQDTTAATSLQLNSERTGKVSVRVTSHDHPKLGFSLLVPVLGMIWGKIRGRD